MTDTTPPANLTPAELAEWQSACAATPGPYQAASWERIIRCDIEGDINPASIAFRFSDGGQQQVVADAHNLATNADPTTVRARLREISDLRDQVAALTAERERLRDALRSVPIVKLSEDDLRWVCVGCQASSGINAVGKEIDQSCSPDCWVAKVESALRTEAGT